MTDRRGQCMCGSLRMVVRDGPYSDLCELPIGVFDDTGGMEMTNEIYFDHKPDAFSYAGQRERLTREQTLEKFGVTETES